MVLAGTWGIITTFSAFMQPPLGTGGLTEARPQKPGSLDITLLTVSFPQPRGSDCEKLQRHFAESDLHSGAIGQSFVSSVG